MSSKNPPLPPPQRQRSENGIPHHSKLDQEAQSDNDHGSRSDTNTDVQPSISHHDDKDIEKHLRARLNNLGDHQSHPMCVLSID